MIVPSAVRSRYVAWQDLVRGVQERVEETLIPYTRKAGYVFEGRCKTMESLAEKLESGRYSHWDDIDDLYACTIAVPLPDEEVVVRDYVEEKFVLLRARDKTVVAKRPEMFLFDSTRLICQLRAPASAIGDTVESIFAVKFEVQIKTIYDFAWSKTTHALTYKSHSVDWKRYRLAAHLKAAAEQIEFLLRGFDDASKHLVESPWASIKDRRKITEFFQNCVIEGKIPSEVVPKDWSRFSENFYRALQALTGQRPTGDNRKKLEIITHALEVLDNHFATLNPKTFPRSVSLYQYCIGYLASTLDDTKSHKKLYFLDDKNLFEVFPEAADKLPGPLFSLD